MQTFLKTVGKTVKHWYIPFIVGALLLILGIYILTTPVASYQALTLLFSISFIVSGVAGILFSLSNVKELEGWGWYLAEGIFNLLAGILLIAAPGLAAATLALFIGFTLLFRSVQGMGFAFELKNYGALHWGNVAISSTLGIVCSLLLLFNPFFAGISLVVLTGMAFIFSGLATIILSIQLRKLKKLPGKIDAQLKEKIENLKEEYYKAINQKD